MQVMKPISIFSIVFFFIFLIKTSNFFGWFMVFNAFSLAAAVCYCTDKSHPPGQNNSLQAIGEWRCVKEMLPFLQRDATQSAVLLRQVICCLSVCLSIRQ